MAISETNERVETVEKTSEADLDEATIREVARLKRLDYEAAEKLLRQAMKIKSARKRINFLEGRKISNQLLDLEEKFEADHDEQSFVDGILAVVRSKGFGYEALYQRVDSDTVYFRWESDYDPVRDEDHGEHLDLDKDPFECDGVSEENRELINAEIRIKVESAIEAEEEYRSLRNASYRW